MNWKFLAFLIFCLGFFFILSCGVENKEENKEIISSRAGRKNYIRKIPGNNDSIPREIAQKGEVLVAYSDCFTCHTLEKRSKGPAFQDIAQRYPIQNAYVEMLAHRVIAGGSGSWGSPIMSPHPELTLEEAKTMVSYILSLKE